MAGPADNFQVGVHRAVVQGGGHLAHAAPVHGHGPAVLIAGAGLVAVGGAGIADGVDIREYLAGLDDLAVAEFGGPVYVKGAVGHPVHPGGHFGQKVLIIELFVAGGARRGELQGDGAGLAGDGLVQNGLGLLRVDAQANHRRGQLAVFVQAGGLGFHVDKLVKALAGELRPGQGLGLGGELGLAVGQGGQHLGEQLLHVQLLAVKAGGDLHGLLAYLIGKVHRRHVQLAGNLLDELAGLGLPLGGKGGGGQGQVGGLLNQAEPEHSQLPEGLRRLGGHTPLHRGLRGAGQQLAGEHHAFALAVLDGEGALVQPLVHGLGHEDRGLVGGELAQLGHRVAPVVHRHRAGQQAAVVLHPGAQPEIAAHQRDGQGRGDNARNQGRGNTFFWSGTFHNVADLLRTQS